MKKLLGACLVALLGVVGCDGGADGDGDGSGSSSSGSSDSNDAASETVETSASTTTGSDSATSSTGSSSSSAGESSSSSGEPATTTSDGESSSSTGEPSTVTPCQPEMSKAQIQDWRADVDGHMPTFADLAQPRTDMRSAAGSIDTLSGGPNPMGGGGGFIVDPDGGGVSVECSVWEQDCPAGEKCAAWASDGGTSWNATRCVPVAEDPVGPGETCTVEGSGVTGMDNCDANSMCWSVNPDTLEGTCIALCEGSEAAPTCAPEATACSISNDGVLILCLPICNPLADECGEGQGCFPAGEFFQCAPVAGGGEPGDSCEFLNACENGSACVNAGVVPDCSGSGCCSSYCDLQGDGSECLEGQECLGWYEMGQEPDACLEGVGICAVP